MSLPWWRRPGTHSLLAEREAVFDHAEQLAAKIELVEQRDAAGVPARRSVKSRRELDEALTTVAAWDVALMRRYAGELRAAISDVSWRRTPDRLLPKLDRLLARAELVAGQLDLPDVEADLAARVEAKWDAGIREAHARADAQVREMRGLPAPQGRTP